MKNLPELNLPPAFLKVNEEEGVLKIYDKLRDKWVVLTPEEWVRQNFVAWMIGTHHYPASLMANEIGVNVNGSTQRCDSVIFRSDGTPFVVMEFKAPNIAVTQNVFDQIVRYNMKLHADYLIVSNGMTHYCCKIDYKNNTYHFIPKIPEYNDIASGASQN